MYLCMHIHGFLAWRHRSQLWLVCICMCICMHSRIYKHGFLVPTRRLIYLHKNACMHARMHDIYTWLPGFKASTIILLDCIFGGALKGNRTSITSRPNGPGPNCMCIHAFMDMPYPQTYIGVTARLGSAGIPCYRRRFGVQGRNKIPCYRRRFTVHVELRAWRTLPLVQTDRLAVLCLLECQLWTLAKNQRPGPAVTTWRC